MTPKPLQASDYPDRTNLWELIYLRATVVYAP